MERILVCLTKLAKVLEDYKKSNPEASVDYQLHGGDNIPLLVSIVTPLLKRVHRNIKQYEELVFVDATSNTEEHNLKVFLFCTHSIAGALPCCILIASDEKQSTLKSGFEMLKNCLPEDAFYGRGSCDWPAVMITDNCDEERGALQFVWPLPKFLLCTFHVLQQVWRWLVNKNHQIAQSDRPQILSMFKQALYAESKYLFECHYDKLLHDTCDHYNNAVQYFEKLYEDHENFAHCFRRDLLMRGNQTNNFVESQFLVLKDVILRRTKEYNVVALIERLTTDLESHYQEKLLSIADGSFDGHYRKRFMGKWKTNKDGGQGYRQVSEEHFSKM